MNLQKNLLKVFNKFTEVFICKSRNFQTDYEDELFFQYYHKVVILPINCCFKRVKKEPGKQFPDFTFYFTSKQWI